MAFSVRRKQMNLSMDQKLRALKRLDKGESVRTVAKNFGVGKSTIGDWKKKRSAIELWCIRRMPIETLKERKSMKESDFNEVNEALYIWFRQTREKGVPINGPILQKKALKFYEELKKDDDPKFVASTGWLNRWKKRYGVRLLSVCGEELSGNTEVKACKRTWSLLRDSFRRDIKRRKDVKGEDDNLPRKKWKYSDEMSFLLPHLKERTNLCNEFQSVDDDSSAADNFDEYDQTNSQCTSSPYTTDTTQHAGRLKALEAKTSRGSASEETPSRELMKFVLDNTSRSNDIHQFFESMATTVQSFPPLERAIVKARVFEVISEMEIDILSRDKTSYSNVDSAASFRASMPNSHNDFCATLLEQTKEPLNVIAPKAELENDGQ